MEHVVLRRRLLFFNVNTFFFYTVRATDGSSFLLRDSFVSVLFGYMRKLIGWGAVTRCTARHETHATFLGHSME